MLRSCLVMCVCVGLVACGDDDGPGGSDAASPLDAAATDSGGTDSGATDSGATDSGATDSGGTDSGATDSGATDGGATDGGATDGGATCRSNRECGRGQYCAGDACDGPGTCVDRPEACPDVYRPVCGCDGNTYSNACYAALDGVRVGSEGVCGDACDLAPPSDRCCYDGRDCRGGTVCYGAVCDPSGAGTCVVAPAPGSCWEDSDCDRGEICSGQSRCPCGAMCLVPDRPGTCVPSRI